MALKPTIFKAQIALADSDRGRFESLSITLAQHPSETLERMLVRLLVYCRNYDDRLEFTRGLSNPEEPDLWQHNDTGEILHWIEVGQPEPGRLRKACPRAKHTSVYAFGSAANTWWSINGDDIRALNSLEVWLFDWHEIENLTQAVRKKHRTSDNQEIHLHFDH